MTLRIFLVEDNPLIREKLTVALQELAPAVVVGFAGDERSAVAWIKKNPLGCDLLIIDVFLMAGSGLGVLSATEHYAAPRVVMSNYATFEMQRRCTELGASRVFDKSNEIELLTEFCRELHDVLPRQ